MDPLSAALAICRLDDAVLAVFDLAAPWGIDCQSAVGTPCHYVVSGTCQVIEPDRAPVRLEAGDMVVFPHWDRHGLASGEGEELVPIQSHLARSGVVVGDPGSLPDVPVRLIADGGGAETRILSMVFRTPHPSEEPLLAGLPARIVFRDADARMSRLLAPTVHFILAEIENQQPGYAIIARRLAELLFMQIVRTQLFRAPGETTGMLRGLSDPHLARAIAAMNAGLGQAWTVDRLARAAGLSRSVFAKRFRELVGAAPHAYLTNLRMRHAAAAIAAGESVKGAARAVGFKSSFGFSHAFRRHFQMTVSDYRTHSIDR